MKDELGDRIKSNYEDRTRYMLPRRSYTILRIDGRAFHTYTKTCKKPFDAELCEDMNSAAMELCNQISGARMAYVQSDEISVLITDFAEDATMAWFDNNLQKMVSVGASITTTAFNRNRIGRMPSGQVGSYIWANFDARAFTIPDRQEVFNYFIWRQADAMRNSISMIARSKFSHSQLDGKHIGQMKQMLKDNGTDIHSFDHGFLNGRLISKHQINKDIVFVHKKTGETQVIKDVPRKEFVAEPAPLFLESKSILDELIPKYTVAVEGPSDD